MHTSLFRGILKLQDWASGDLASVYGFTINFLKDLSNVWKWSFLHNYTG